MYFTYTCYLLLNIQFDEVSTRKQLQIQEFLENPANLFIWRATTTGSSPSLHKQRNVSSAKFDDSELINIVINDNLFSSEMSEA